jgi:hypothetical protein
MLISAAGSENVKHSRSVAGRFVKVSSIRPRLAGQQVISQARSEGEFDLLRESLEHFFS